MKVKRIVSNVATSDVDKANAFYKNILGDRTLLLVALGTWLITGIGYPYLDLALACRIPDAEACVWGKAYFPLTMGLSLTLLGGLAAGVVYAVIVWRRRKSGGDDAA